MEIFTENNNMQFLYLNLYVVIVIITENAKHSQRENVINQMCTYFLCIHTYIPDYA